MDGNAWDLVDEPLNAVGAIGRRERDPTSPSKEEKEAAGGGGGRSTRSPSKVSGVDSERVLSIVLSPFQFSQTPLRRSVSPVPRGRETSEPRYVEWSDYVMRSYEHLPTLAYSTFHEFRKKDEKIHCKITIYDNSWYSEQKAFALAFIMKSSEMYFTGSGFDEDFETDHRERSPAIDTFRKVGRSFFEKIGLVAKRRDLVHETAPADELPEYPLDDFCKRPIEFFHEEKKFSFDDLLSAKEKEELKPQGEKCSYLFRGASLEELGEFPSDLQPEYEYDPYCPVHGSRRRLKRRKDKLITMQTLMSSVDNADSADRLPSYIYSQDFIAKIIRKQKRLQMSGDEKRRADKIMQKIKSNLWTISLAFLFLFTAFHGLQNLQTSVNDHLGGDSLMAHYVSLAISSLFVPSFMIDRLGCKQTLIISMSIYTLYIFTNFLPRYYSLIPSSILAGIAGSCLWGAKCAYITECGMRYARLNVEAPNTVIVRFFGYFFMIVHLGQVSGNLISSYILEAAIGFVPPHDQVIDTCGHSYPKNFSELSERAALNLLRPPQSAIVSVCAAYLGCAMVAVMIVAMFLNALHKDTINRTKKPQFNAQILKLSLKNFANVKVLLLIPLTIFNGLEQAFVVGVYTKSFVGCGLGISQIGFVMTAFGVTDAICSLVFGPLIKLFGRTPLFVFGAVINMLMIVTLAIWSLNPTDSLVFYVIAGVWGMADGVWNTQINGFWVALVGRQSLDLAFANYRFWESLGIALGFLLLRFTSVQEFLWISISVLLLGICGYICIELYDLIISYLNMEKLMEMICIWRRKPLPTQEPTSMQVSLLSSTPMATSATQPTSMLTSTTTNPETI
ncbi:unnamed protein product, partial [Mesorhabditis belari]|uniref:Uncharacterized protein n=1 Tax=Mesorhabditis belari TaxID=2138241 RepID=A0AAF3J2Q2_9BILA